MKEYQDWLLKAYNLFLHDTCINVLANDRDRRSKQAFGQNRRADRIRFHKWDSKFKAEITRIELSIPFEK